MYRVMYQQSSGYKNPSQSDGWVVYKCWKSSIWPKAGTYTNYWLAHREWVKVKDKSYEEGKSILNKLHGQ